MLFFFYSRYWPNFLNGMPSFPYYSNNFDQFKSHVFLSKPCSLGVDIELYRVVYFLGDFAIRCLHDAASREYILSLEWVVTIQEHGQHRKWYILSSNTWNKIVFEAYMQDAGRAYKSNNFNISRFFGFKVGPIYWSIIKLNHIWLTSLSRTQFLSFLLLKDVVWIVGTV